MGRQEASNNLFHLHYGWAQAQAYLHPTTSKSQISIFCTSSSRQAAGGRRRPACGMNAQFHINCSGQVQSTARGGTKEVHITLQNKRNQISHPKSFTLHHLLTFLLLPPASPAISGGSCCSSLDTPLSPVIGLSISIAAVISST